MVARHDGGPVLGDVVGAVDVEAGVRKQLRPQDGTGHVEGLEPGQLGHASGHVEVADGPTPQGGEDAQPDVGVHRVRMTHRRQERDVEDAVGVGPAVTQHDPVVVTPAPDGGDSRTHGASSH